MSSRPVLALVVPSLEAGGGVPSVAGFMLETAEAAGWDVNLVSLAMSSRDPESMGLSSPRTWRPGARTRCGTWRGRPFTHVGCTFAEVETRRYARRPLLSRVLAGADVVQVVAGSPAWANAVIGLGMPVSLHVATRVLVERRLRNSLGRGFVGAWRRRMTQATDKVELKALQGVDALQVMNQWMLEEARSEYSSHLVDLRLAPPGVDADSFVPRPGDGSSRYVLSVGRFDDPRKNVTLLLAAFAGIAERIPDVALVTAGATAPPAEFDAAVVSAGLVRRVRHIARPSHDELVRLYQDAEVFALSSDEEGLGVVLLEAMACGVPVVSTRSGGPDGVITDELDGYLVERNSADQLGDRLLDLLTDRRLRDQMGKEARRTIESRYAMRVAGQQFVDVWNKLLEGRG